MKFSIFNFPAHNATHSVAGGQFSHSKFNRQSGFTLVELLVYMGIFSILLLVLMQIFTAILSVHAESQATSSVEQDGNFILSRLAYDIRRASAVNVISSTSLQLTEPDGTYTYQYDSAALVLKLTSPSGTAPLNSYTTSIKRSTDVSFTQLGNAGGKPTVQILLTLTSTTRRPGNAPNSESFQTTVGTR